MPSLIPPNSCESSGQSRISARSAEELPNRPAPSGGLTARATVLEVGHGPGEAGWLRRPSMLTEIDNAECR